MLDKQYWDVNGYNLGTQSPERKIINIRTNKTIILSTPCHNHAPHRRIQTGHCE